PSLAGQGYSTVLVTQSLPRSSKAMFIGLLMSGSLATSWASNPGGRWKPFFSSAGDRASPGATSGASLGFCDRANPEKRSSVKTAMESRERLMRFLNRQAGAGGPESPIIRHGTISATLAFLVVEIGVAAPGDATTIRQRETPLTCRGLL